jgi:hypothetical protein
MRRLFIASKMRGRATFIGLSETARVFWSGYANSDRERATRRNDGSLFFYPVDQPSPLHILSENIAFLLFLFIPIKPIDLMPGNVTIDSLPDCRKKVFVQQANIRQTKVECFDECQKIVLILACYQYINRILNVWS